MPLEIINVAVGILSTLISLVGIIIYFEKRRHSKVDVRKLKEDLRDKISDDVVGIINALRNVKNDGKVVKRKGKFEVERDLINETSGHGSVKVKVEKKPDTRFVARNKKTFSIDAILVYGDQ